MTDSQRPFGAHLRMAWWKPLIVIIVPPVAMVLLQMLFYAAAAMFEGSGTDANIISPLQFLAINLSMGVTGLLAVPFIAKLAGVPWRSVLSFPRRFDGRRLARYLGCFLVVMVAANGILAVVAPESTGWSAFAMSGTTVVLLVLVVLTTPLQAVAEELMFRGAIMPAAASWIRPIRPALFLGIILSSLVFALFHGSADPWLFGYYTFFGLCAALMAVISRGLEASIAFHVVNNVVASILNAIFADGGTFVVDRSTGAGGAHLLILVPVLLLAVGLVWIFERRTRASRSTHNEPLSDNRTSIS